MDTKSFLGAKPLKAGIGLGVVAIAAFVLSLFSGNDAWDKLAWASLTLVVTIGFFFACWLIALTRTPWKFEDEFATEREVERNELLARIDELEKNLRLNQHCNLADGERKNKLLAIRRWIESGEELVSEIDKNADDEIGYELLSKITAWTKNADSYIEKNFFDFCQRFQSDDGIPPRLSNDSRRHHENARKDVYRRVARMKELENLT